jgi:hypothetical protein
LLAAVTCSRASESPVAQFGGVERYDVLASERRNRTAQHRLDVLALANFARHAARDPLVGCAPHELQCFADGLIGDDIQIRRLLELHCKRLLQSPVEHWVARGVDKIREQNGISRGQLLPRTRSPVKPTSNHRREKKPGSNPHPRRDACLRLRLSSRGQFGGFVRHGHARPRCRR